MCFEQRRVEMAVAPGVGRTGTRIPISPEETRTAKAAVHATDLGGRHSRALNRRGRRCLAP